MKKTNLFFALILLAFASAVFAQSARELHFKWIVNPRFDSSKTEVENLLSNANDSTTCIFVSGKTVRNSQGFVALANAVKESDIPIKVFPAFSDLAESERLLKFEENFDAETFLFKKNKFLFVGINSGNPLDTASGIFKPENLIWLSDEVNSLGDSLQVILFTDKPPAKIKNFYRLANIFKNDFLETVFLPSKPDMISDKYYFVYPLDDKNKYDIFLNPQTLTVKSGGNVIFEQNFKKRLSATNENETDLFRLENQKLKEIWTQTINASVYFKPLIYKGKIYIAQNDGLLTCFDSQGSELWDYDLFGDAAASPVARDGFLLAATLQGDLALLNALNGDALQTVGLESAVTTNLFPFSYKWKIETMAPKKSGSDAAIVYGNAAGEVVCRDIETLEEIWNTKIRNGKISGKIYGSGNELILQTDKKLLALDKKNGAILWENRFDEKILGEIAIGRTTMFAATESKIYSIDIKLGSLNWTNKKYKPSAIFLSKNMKYLYAFEKNGSLVFAKSGNGKFVKKFPLKLSGENFFALTLNKNLIAGNIYALYRINKKLRYSTILNSELPLISVEKFGKNKLLFADINGNLLLAEYFEK